MTAVTPLLAPDADFDPGSQKRADARSNMYVMAVLDCDLGSAPARIRNLSRSGALIETAVITPAGSQVRLTRASLSVSGHIVWSRENRAGIQFDAAIAVADWLPGGNRPTGQQRVDEMIHACRTATTYKPDNLPAPAGMTQAEARNQLLEFRDALNMVAGELASDLAIAVAHPTALQTIDVTAQKLEKLASLLADGGYIPPSTGS